MLIAMSEKGRERTKVVAYGIGELPRLNGLKLYRQDEAGAVVVVANFSNPEEAELFKDFIRTAHALANDYYKTFIVLENGGVGVDEKRVGQ